MLHGLTSNGIGEDKDGGGEESPDTDSRKNFAANKVVPQPRARISFDAERQAAVDGTKLALADMESVGAFDESLSARRTPHLRHTYGQCGRAEENSATDFGTQFAGRNE